MKNSYRFYCNKDCQYFPCHEVTNEDDFNCMFCYCPLYLLEDCKGNYTYHSGIKDCSKCLIPHSKGGYDHINNLLREEVFTKAVERNIREMEEKDKENKEDK